MRNIIFKDSLHWIQLDSAHGTEALAKPEQTDNRKKGEVGMAWVLLVDEEKTASIEVANIDISRPRFSSLAYACFKRKADLSFSEE